MPLARLPLMAAAPRLIEALLEPRKSTVNWRTSVGRSPDAAVKYCRVSSRPPDNRTNARQAPES